jgi:hypothetical protein
MTNLTRNDKNSGKKRPVCACGTEMTYAEFNGYYDSFEYWLCENNACSVKDSFVADITERGAYA